MKKFTKTQKKQFIQNVRMMKEPKVRKPKSKRVPDASGPGGALP